VGQRSATLAEGRIISVDGKTLRGSSPTKEPGSFIHMVSAWCSENHLVLAQQKVDDKSNEITAIPTLLDLLVIKGCLVTIDAMGGLPSQDCRENSGQEGGLPPGSEGKPEVSAGRYTGSLWLDSS
jgi:hypothetical protein